MAGAASQEELEHSHQATSFSPPEIRNGETSGGKARPGTEYTIINSTTKLDAHGKPVRGHINRLIVTDKDITEENVNYDLSKDESTSNKSALTVPRLKSSDPERPNSDSAIAQTQIACYLPASSQNDSLFHRLPAELRFEIYNYLLISEKPLEGSSKRNGDTGVFPVLLRVCQSIHFEALPILYSKNTININSPHPSIPSDLSAPFTIDIPSRLQPLLRRVLIHLHSWSHTMDDDPQNFGHVGLGAHFRHLISLLEASASHLTTCDFVIVCSRNHYFWEPIYFDYDSPFRRKLLRYGRHLTFAIRFQLPWGFYKQDFTCSDIYHGLDRVTTELHSLGYRRQPQFHLPAFQPGAPGQVQPPPRPVDDPNHDLAPELAKMREENKAKEEARRKKVRPRSEFFKEFKDDEDEAFDRLNSCVMLEEPGSLRGLGWYLP